MAVFLAAGVAAAHGIHITPEPSKGIDDTTIDRRTLTDSDVDVMKLPELAVFKEEWTTRHEHDPNRGQQLPPTVQIVFGFPAVLSETLEDYWQVHKSSWMSQPGVCSLGAPPKQRPGCTVYVARVVGNGQTFVPRGRGHGPPLDARSWEFRSDDVLWMDMTENLNNGKTFWLFHVLSASVPFATHIAKVDLDAYPYVHKLTTFLHSQQGCASDLQYVGVPMKRSWWKQPSHNLSSTCASQTCFEDIDMTFHQGGMYVVSRALALGMTGDLSGYYSSNKVGWEDEVFGLAVRQYQANIAGAGCVSVFYAHGAWHHPPNMVVDPYDPLNNYTMDQVTQDWGRPKKRR